MTRAAVGVASLSASDSDSEPSWLLSELSTVFRGIRLGRVCDCALREDARVLSTMVARACVSGMGVTDLTLYTGWDGSNS